MGTAVETNADRRRRDILDSAAHLFSTVGYANVSVEDIATESGMSKPTLYHYFASREEVVAAMHEVIARDMLVHAISLRDSDTDPIDAIRSIISMTIQGINERPGYLRVFFEHYREISEPLYKPIAEKRQQYTAIMEELIRNGIDRGEFRAVDPRIVALAIFGMCNWTYQWYRRDEGMAPEAIAKVFTDMLFSGIASPD